MTVKDHYDKHLGNFYSWMAGDFNEKTTEHLKIFNEYQIKPDVGSIAIDLGCGHGIQSLALAKLGYKVIAVDFNEQLLKELTLNSENQEIEVVNSDIIKFLTTCRQVQLISCMGDTITHLSQHQLQDFFQLSSKKLDTGGKLIISFRDLLVELQDDARFIPVRADDQRILTCFLEYFPNHVVVHDILWEKSENGWSQRVSSYPKLRLSREQIISLLEENGFILRNSEQINRMNFILAEKE